MFEDLIGKRIVNKIIEVFDLQNQCPHCKTNNIVKRMKWFFCPSETMVKSQQPAYCSKCRKLWYIVSEEEENEKKNTYIQHMSKKSGV